MRTNIKRKRKVERTVRCRGTRVEEVRGQFKNVPCKEPATEQRELRGEKTVTMHYCAKCAADWDAQQAVIAAIL